MSHIRSVGSFIGSVWPRGVVKESVVGVAYNILRSETLIHREQDQFKAKA